MGGALMRADASPQCAAGMCISARHLEEHAYIIKPKKVHHFPCTHDCSMDVLIEHFQRRQFRRPAPV